MPPKRALHRRGGRHGGEERRANRGQERQLVSRRHPDRLRGRRQAPDPDRGRRQRPVALAIRISARRHPLGQGPLVTGMRSRAANPVDRVVLGARAALSLGSQPSGASTITQQLARRLYLADDPSPLAARKAHEALIALQLEANRSKTEILELYLNDVYYGRGAYGVEAAARVYFGIGAGNLDLAHAAYLAGLPQRPSDHDPAKDAAVARVRQAYVLGRMVQDGWISDREADAAASERIEVLPAVLPPIAHQFVGLALAELARVRPDLAARDGLVVETTLDAGLQQEAERLIRIRLDE